MSWIGVVLCTVATWRLRATPLAGAALVITSINAAATLGAAVAQRRRGQAPRTAVALQHVTAALGAFFLFVSLTIH